ncbi:hypothetical protein [Embleya sp. NPDC005575]|uniref:hypothetical protein n=1 Tax=Embleya sp. NPDC005575 TaxID=3156892 RepID=UPI0033A46C73
MNTRPLTGTTIPAPTVETAPATPPVPWRRLVGAEISRALAPRTVRYALYALPLLVVAFGISQILSHDTDMAGAWRTADAAYRRYAEEAAAHARPLPPRMSANAFFDDPRYQMAKATFVDLRGIVSALGAGAVVFGILAGGADWTTRVMLPLTATEPRRARLFTTRALVVAALAATVAAATALLTLPFLLTAATLNGSMAGTDTRFWLVLSLLVLRGMSFVAIMALIGYALAMLTRRTSIALAIAFAYVVLGERLLRDFASGVFEYHLSGLTFALLNERPMMPSDVPTGCVGEVACAAMREGLTAGHGYLGLFVHLMPILTLAAWRYVRTDIK